MNNCDSPFDSYHFRSLPLFIVADSEAYSSLVTRYRCLLE